MVGTKRYVGRGVADTPLIVFINAKSGGRVGPRLLNVLFRSLGQAQVVCGRVGGRAGVAAWPWSVWPQRDGALPHFPLPPFAPIAV